MCQDGKVPVWGPLSPKAPWAVGSGQRGQGDPGRDSEAERSFCIYVCVCFKIKVKFTQYAGHDLKERGSVVALCVCSAFQSCSTL